MKVGDTVRERFVLESVLGQSATGTVYKALDLRQQEAEVEDPYLALKVLDRRITANKALGNELCRVTVKTRTLQHPNIMNFYEFDSHGGDVYLTIPLIEGLPLNIYLEQNDITFAEAMDIIHGAGTGLAYAHSKGFVHGDFSSANIYYTVDRTAMVFDFGVRCVFQDFMGPNTSAYASAAVIKGITPGTIDDVYSLAVVSYELLNGQHPYHELNAVQAAQQKLKPEKISRMSAAAWDTLNRALALEGNDRIGSVDAFIHGMGL